jgi:hypothetical protein
MHMFVLRLLRPRQTKLGKGDEMVKIEPGQLFGIVTDLTLCLF